MVNELRAQSWNQLHDWLFEDAWDEQIGRYRSRCAFRGMSNANYSLETALIRLGGNYEQLERHMLRNFRKYAHRSTVKRDSIWEWLTVAQHYGLPTRLMDWTYSPFVAMHFATASVDEMHNDGVIWAVNYVKTHRLLPEKLRLDLQTEGANIFTVEMLSDKSASSSSETICLDNISTVKILAPSVCKSKRNFSGSNRWVLT